jgi:hypothetical protein
MIICFTILKITLGQTGQGNTGLSLPISLGETAQTSALIFLEVIFPRGNHAG